jgi:16S rRNA (adenine1518-N6/adenine1519-N6)-dimethyltransferase
VLDVNNLSIDQTMRASTLIRNAKQVLRRYGIRPKKSLGQNFIIDPKALRHVIKAADLTGGDTVLEVGTGLGTLTVHLANEVTKVVSVELDSRLIPILIEVLEPYENIELVFGDILEVDLPSLLGDDPYIVVANIPYNITSLLIRRLLETQSPPKRLVLTMQREVAERITAEPGSMSLLAVSVQLYGRPRIMAQIPSSAFYPQPQVDSAVLRVDLYEEPVLPQELTTLIFDLARAGFQQKRKKLRNALKHRLNVPVEVIERWLIDAEIPPASRAQELSLEAWRRLALVVSKELDNS